MAVADGMVVSLGGVTSGHPPLPHHPSLGDAGKSCLSFGVNALGL